MPMKIGNKAVNKIMIGDKEVLKVVVNGDIKYQKNTNTKYTISFNYSCTANNSSTPYTTIYFASGLSTNWNHFLEVIKQTIDATVPSYIDGKINDQGQALINLYRNAGSAALDYTNIKITQIVQKSTSTFNRLYYLYNNTEATTSNYNSYGVYYSTSYSSGNTVVNTNIPLDSTYPNLQFALSNYAWFNSWVKPNTSWDGSEFTFEFESPYLDALLETAVNLV